ncbi:MULTISPECIES: hypothetical protein [Pseudomonas]|uniref:Uncharacterized protein n=2 Tax=Pseudomonas fragariae (ex Marin et al. 2024) TaxID=3080056 RepID=A0ABT3LLV0_9PSED|nr:MULTISPECIES: hypothetical protein [Pseudomonas]MCW6057439.1 hypothetical protein [Pseudomonas fragi]AVB28102.1 hypothetical protein BKC06_025045 [Pseudomonas syringae pv. syringae]KWS10607.1 hypothetical protein AL063_17240 [Pseudomonas syringae pv. syringae]MCF5028678.1 hypothetical protein [Pseudomonas syringae]MCF5182419.1 hypothetical protein [Pseudomonas syringae]
MFFFDFTDDLVLLKQLLLEALNRQQVNAEALNIIVQCCSVYLGHSPAGVLRFWKWSKTLATDSADCAGPVDGNISWISAIFT